MLSPSWPGRQLVECGAQGLPRKTAPGRHQVAPVDRVVWRLNKVLTAAAGSRTGPKATRRSGARYVSPHTRLQENGAQARRHRDVLHCRSGAGHRCQTMATAQDDEPALPRPASKTRWRRTMASKTRWRRTMASKTQRCSVAEAPPQVPGQRDVVILPWRHIIDDAVRAERGGEERRLAGHPGQSGLSCGRFTGLSVDSE